MFPLFLGSSYPFLMLGLILIVGIVSAHLFYQQLGFRMDDYPNASAYYTEGLSIPLFFDLTDEEQEYVITAFEELIG